MSVHLFKSSQVGAPVLDGQAGSLFNVLKACLIDGYAPITIATINRTTTVATVEALDHGFSTGDNITIAGADQSGFNGNVVVASVPNSHSFTYTVVDTLPAAATTATALTAKRRAVGWEYTANGTNKGYFRIPNSCYLDLDDSGLAYSDARFAAAKGWKEIGTQYASYMDFPRPGVVGFIKSSTSDATAREWVVVASPTMMYLWVNSDGGADGAGGRLHMFGHTAGEGVAASGSIMPVIIGGNGYNGVTILPTDLTKNYCGNLSENMYVVPPVNAYYLNTVLEQQMQTNSMGTCGLISDWSKSNGQVSVGQAASFLPTIPATSYHVMRFAPLYVYDRQTNGAYSFIRGLLPGLWNPIESGSDVASGSMFGQGVGYLPADANRKFIFLRMAPTSNDVAKPCSIAIEYSDTWITTVA